MESDGCLLIFAGLRRIMMDIGYLLLDFDYLLLDVDELMMNFDFMTRMETPRI